MVPSSSLSFGIDLKHCAGSSSFNLVSAWSPVLIHVLGRLWCEVRLLAKEREREREREGILLLSQISPHSVPPHIVACWQPFGAITCHAVTDLCVMCSIRTLRFLCGAEGCVCVQSQNQRRIERQDRQQGMWRCWWDVGVVLEVRVKGEQKRFCEYLTGYAGKESAYSQ